MTNVSEVNRKARKILIADDDPAIVSALSARCTKMGFQVATAANGMQALLMARLTQPDILIVDVNMPEVSGLMVCSHLLAPSRKPTEVIVVTGCNDPETVERCESMGVFYGHKGPNFWENISFALMKIAPEMADNIEKLGKGSVHDQVSSSPRILIVDDDPEIYHFFFSRLRKVGVDVFYAPDATRGFRIACSAQPSVIICDNYMPNGDASYFLSMLRSMRETENVPVFVFSSQQIDKMTEKSLTQEIRGRPGATRVFRKSFDTTEIFESLQRFCSFKSELAPMAGPIVANTQVKKN